MATYKPLSTDFKDDILASQNSKRKYTQVNNPDGTVSFQDSTAYSQVGSSYGAKEVNEEREAINNIYENKLVTLDEIDLVTEPGFFVDAQVVKELNSKSGDVAQNNVTQQVYNLLGGALIVVGGTKKVTLSGSNDYIQLFTKDELRELFGSEFDPRRLTIITNNGDALITNTHLYEPEFWQSSGSYYQYYYPKITGDCRINYLMVYRPA